MKLSVVIPAYNEERTIEQVVRAVENLRLAEEVIVVDDGSTDGTPKILERLKKEHGIRVLTSEKNRGKGAALRTALHHLSGDVVIVQDADLELNPKEIPKLFEVIQSGKADVVYGCRFSDGWGHISIFNSFANWFLSNLTNFLYGIHIRDMETGYKMFKTEHLA